jgi:hypothetical protein
MASGVEGVAVALGSGRGVSIGGTVGTSGVLRPQAVRKSKVRMIVKVSLDFKRRAPR